MRTPRQSSVRRTFLLLTLGTSGRWYFGGGADSHGTLTCTKVQLTYMTQSNMIAMKKFSIYPEHIVLVIHSLPLSLRRRQLWA